MLIALEMALVLGGVLGLAVWELLRLRRDKMAVRKSQDAAAESAAPSAEPPAPPPPTPPD